MKAIILVGGEGTRLRPLTLCLPKALAAVVNEPMIYYMLGWLKKHGVKEAILVACYLPSKLKKVIGSRYSGMKIRYIYEDSPLGTGGAIKRAEKYLTGTTVVMNGDLITNIDLSKMMRFHKSNKAKATIALTPVEDPSAFGLVETSKDGRVTGFIEKPSPEEVQGKETNINAGVYLFEPEVLKLMQFSKVYSIERDIFPVMVGKGFYGMVFKKIYWMDCGTVEKYRKVTRDVLLGKFTPFIKVKMKNGVSIGEDSVIASGSKIAGTMVIGKNCSVSKNVLLKNCIIWDRVQIDEGAVLQNCILAHGCMIGKNSILNGAVLGADICIMPGSKMKNC
ncbi:MAG: hypothetical protein A2452_10655 [Candidatus Firestonebacteria bacterium RIFOXYC2_FULL_39_67]|nr:MAG: hypothetical protein A2536_09765 [Candidatus Firestonebacteria bacterium RIFOXYD2_FULL_39_29]OGF57010.1 MAG: hypothetical protein A2452_10655 [Candidatus Firestonebacteria bacterium RIFOXYC2_FULL_39_67]